jgi:PAS domain S-box-containing protein
LRRGKAEQSIDWLRRFTTRNLMIAGGHHRALLRSLLDVRQDRGRTAVLREGAALLNRTLPVESVTILRQVGRNHAFRIVATAGGSSLRNRSGESSRLERLLGRALRRQRPLIVPDLVEWTPRRIVPNGKRTSQARGMIVRIDGLAGPFGVLTLRSRRHTTFGKAEARMAAAVADLLSLAVKRFDNARRLKESARRYRRLVDGASNVIFRAALVPTLRIEHLSPAIETLTGYAAREFYQDPRLVTRIIHPEDLPAFRAQLEHPEQIREHVRLRIVGKDGQRTWVSVAWAPIVDRRGKVVAVQGSVCEIYDRVVDGEQLRATAESTAAILQGHRFDTALRIILHHLRYVLDADEVTIAADNPEKRTLRIIGRAGGDGRGSARRATVSRDDPLIRRAVAADQPVLIGRNIAALVPWSSGRLGVLIIRGVSGDNAHLAKAMIPVDRFAHEIALAVESLRKHQEHLQQVIQEDRSRIARELHDGVVQSLFAAGMMLQMNADSLPEQARGGISRAAAGIREAIQDIQQYVFDLEPSVLMPGGLARSLQRIVLDFESASGITTSLETDRDATDALEGAAAHVLQIVREALSNVRRHAQAHSVAVTLRSTGRANVLEIRDDGGGFSAEAVQGLGIRNLRTRAKLLGGKLELHSEPGEGSVVRLTVPSTVREPQVHRVPLPA